MVILSEYFVFQLLIRRDAYYTSTSALAFRYIVTIPVLALTLHSLLYFQIYRYTRYTFKIYRYYLSYILLVDVNDRLLFKVGE